MPIGLRDTRIPDISFVLSGEELKYVPLPFPYISRWTKESGEGERKNYTVKYRLSFCRTLRLELVKG